MNKKVVELLRELSACQPALAWVEQQKDIKTAWNKCSELAWLEWLIVALSTKNVQLKLGKYLRRYTDPESCYCAECALAHLPVHEAAALIRSWVPVPTIKDLELASKARSGPYKDRDRVKPWVVA